MGVSLEAYVLRRQADLQAGWINELLARLTESAPDAGPTINSTLDDDPNTFPRGGKRLFVVSSSDRSTVMPS